MTTTLTLTEFKTVDTFTQFLDFPLLWRQCFSAFGYEALLLLPELLNPAA
nr:hypothetical protein [Martelella alba]